MEVVCAVEEIEVDRVSLPVNLSINSCRGTSSRFSMRVNSWTKNMKCLNEVFKCASSPS